MEFQQIVDRLRAGQDPKFPANANSREFAETLNSQDPVKHLRDEFILPTRGSLKKKALTGVLPGTAPPSWYLLACTYSGANPSTGSSQTNGHAHGETNGHVPSHDGDDDEVTSTYFVGNSLGAQPKAVRRYIDAQLETWASIGVNGHFTALGNSPLVPWQDMAAECARHSSDLVGASPEEIVIMNTITVNLHLMLASFYRPTERRHKILVEWKPFPSDYYAVETQIQWHGLDPRRSMVPIQPDEDYVISWAQIKRAIDEHADETAVLLLPGVQYYSGQLFEMERITRYARERGIPVVGWDLAHAAGNVELRLHDWDVDFAVWCTYKYMNAGPGAIAGAFVHAKHGGVEPAADGPGFRFRHRLAGWYGEDKRVRFDMALQFRPTPGAAGFQLSNPSAVDLAGLAGALSVFARTSMRELRDKSLALTAYAQHLLAAVAADAAAAGAPAPFRLITPADPAARGAQLSLLLRPGLLDTVGAALEAHGVVCDKRKPDVLRVAPVPLYCNFVDVFDFMDILRRAIASA